MPPKKDYSGLTVNNRFVIGLSRITRHGDPMWNVRCVCGHEFESLTQDLKRRQCRNCRMRHRRKRPYESLYNTFVQKALKNGHTVDLTYDQFASLTFTTNCHYCDAEVFWLKYQTRTPGKKYRGQAYNLDRKDSNQPYTLENVVVCCSRCNLAKNINFSYEEWLEIGNLIRSWRS